MLTGKYARGRASTPGTRLASVPAAVAEGVLSDAVLDRVEALEAFASERPRTPTELAIGWLLAIPEVCSVIAGATRP